MQNCHLNFLFKIISQYQINELNKISEDDNHIKLVLNLDKNTIIDLNSDFKFLKTYRPGQQKFRIELIKRYRGKCPISGHQTDMSDACHIFDYHHISPEKDAMDVYNGILMSTVLHRAFDRGYFTFDEETCCIKILKPNNIFEGNGVVEGKYLFRLDNSQTKKYLIERNKRLLIK